MPSLTPRLPRGRRRGAPFALIVAASAILTALPAVALPAAAHADELPLVDTTEQIGPGIQLRHLKAVDETGWYDARFLTVDLSDEAVGTDLLTSGPVASGGPLSEAANRVGAVAGVNGEFFDIGNSNAALGAEIQGGELLKSADIGGRESVGVSTDGIAQLVDLAVDASAEFGGTTHPVLTINAANGSGVPADGLIAYTPEWGTYSRNRAFGSVDPAKLAEVIVKDDVVVSVAPKGPAGDGALPEGGFALVGRDAAAEALRALKPGDPVSLSYELSDEAARDMQFALGTGGTIIEDGEVLPGLDRSVAPRTALGFKDDGRTLILATWDGPGGTGKGGVGIDKEARDLAALGVETAVNLDGGGSTTMVARELGDDTATVRNVPSDGHERNDPNGVGVFVEPGDGRLHQLVVDAAPGAASADGTIDVFAGMHRALVARGVDDHLSPVTVDQKQLRWSAHGSGHGNGGADIRGGVLTAPSSSGTVTVTAAVRGTKDEQDVRVLGKVAAVELSTARLSLPEPTPENAATVTVTGRDAEGYAAPLDARDLTLDYDHSVVSVEAADGGLKITPLTAAGTILTVTAGGAEVKLPITVGVQTVTVYDFDDDVLARWGNNSTAATTRSVAPEGLQIDFAGMRNVGIAALNGNRVDVPGQPLRLRMHLKSSISVPSGLTYLGYLDANGKSGGVYGTALAASADWQDATFTLPANTAFPIRISSFQGINTAAAQQKAGTFVLDRIEADVPTSIDLPALPELVADRMVSPDGSALDARHAWQFATLSDVQFTADNPELTKVATAAIARIRATDPDLVVLNGDITDRGLPQDIALAKQVLTDAGCDLIPVGAEPAADSTPAPGADTVPCYYVPGNHESYGLNNTQSDLTNWIAEFGQPYRTFDHKGTRFVLLASSLGSLRATDWDQLPMLRDALQSARTDRSIDNVVVFAHHPVDDPADPNVSEISDRNEVALIEQLLGDFRDETGKGAMMAGSHAQIADVHRVEGVPYMVLPSSGKDPYGTPDRGGFTGWVDWTVDPGAKASQQWIQADVRAFAQSIELDAPETLKVGATGTVSGSIVQPQGVSNGTRVVPLRYPMSVHISGSKNLAIGSGEKAAKDARAHGKAAIIDPVTRVVTALAPGKVDVTVTNDSMRELTDAASLAPITATRTITVVSSKPSPVFDAADPVFTAQPIGTHGQVQRVTITNTGDADLRLSGTRIEGDGKGHKAVFSIEHDRCDGKLAPGASCTVSVRFAPRIAGVTSEAELVFQTNTADRRESIALVGTSVAVRDRASNDGPALVG